MVWQTSQISRVEASSRKIELCDSTNQRELVLVPGIIPGTVSSPCPGPPADTVCTGTSTVQYKSVYSREESKEMLLISLECFKLKIRLLRTYTCVQENTTTAVVSRSCLVVCTLSNLWLC